MKDTTTHPGTVLWSDWLEPLHLTVTDAAAALGVTRKTLSALLNGRQGISPEMSIRLGRALGVPDDMWLLRQLAYDLAHIDRRTIRVQRFSSAQEQESPDGARE